MITLTVGAAQELRDDLWTAANGTLPAERATAQRNLRLARELGECTGSEDYVELTDELVEIAQKWGYIG
jgi:hypothetical protein